MDMQQLFEQFHVWILSFGETNVCGVALAIAFFGSIIESLPIIGMFLIMQSLTIFFGIMAYNEILNLQWVALAIMGGMIAGDVLSYWMGVRFGEKRIRNYLSKLKINDKKYSFIHATMTNHFFKTYFVSRSSGFTRWIVPFLSGVNNASLPLFVLYNVSTSLFWAWIFLLGGYYLGFGFEAIEKYIFFGIIGFIIVLFAIYKYILTPRE
jgi:membrane protein DedA with SNARE-associated domain